MSTAQALDHIEIVEVASPADLKAFIRVPINLHEGKENWIFPLEFDAMERLSRKKNPFFQFGEAQYFLAKKKGQIVGRISAQVNNLYLERYNNKTGQFGYLDAVDDPAVFAKLIEAAADWLRKKGMACMQGPFQLSINEESGLLVEGFDTPPAMLMGHAEPYYGGHVESCGLRKCKDLHAFKVATNEGTNARIDRLLKKSNTGEVHIRQMNLKKIDHEIQQVFEIFEDAWSDNWGYVPFSQGELKHMAESMKLILKPELALIAEIEGESAGMLICLPNVNEAIADLRGKLLPLGWLKLLWRLKIKGLNSGRVILAGVRKKYHGTMLATNALGGMLAQLRDNAEELGYDYGELSWVLEDNKPVQRLLAMGGYKPYKTYRIYEKELG